jgi:very-short-patch-repair endonuclease
VEVTVPRERRRKAPGVVHRNGLARVDVTAVAGIPVTTVARTLIDVAATTDPDVVEEALDEALGRGLLSISRIRWRLGELGRGRPGVGVMRALVDARDSRLPTSESVLETKLLRVLRRARLPEPLPQHKICDGSRVVARVDLAYPDHRLAIEADGFRWHSGRMRWQRDRARANDLMLLGWRVIRVTWDDITLRPDHVIASIRAALAST